jgi:acetyltransferase-like isoleucine patch superfamily enzyme
MIAMSAYTRRLIHVYGSNFMENIDDAALLETRLAICPASKEPLTKTPQHPGTTGTQSHPNCDRTYPGESARMDGAVQYSQVNHTVKRFLRLFVCPIIRFLWPAAERLQRLYAYVILASRLPTQVDPSVVVLSAPQILGTARVLLGRNLRLYPDVYLETQESGSIEIGDDTVISGGVHIVSHASITIGAGTMIGEYSSIRDGNHRRDSNGAIRETGHDSAPISIGNNVWIGRGVIILPGVRIGHRATVGANAVVTANVPEDVCVAGVPARIIVNRDAHGEHRGLQSEKRRRNVS